MTVETVQTFLFVFTAACILLALSLMGLTLWLEKRHSAHVAAARKRAMPTPDWAAFHDIFPLSNSMIQWQEAARPTAKQMMDGPMMRLLNLCFARWKSNSDRAHAMDYFRAWAEQLGREGGQSPGAVRALVEERLEDEDGRLAWLLDIFDGRLDPKRAPPDGEPMDVAGLRSPYICSPPQP